MQKLFHLLQTDNSGINLFSLLTYVHIITAIFCFYRSFELSELRDFISTFSSNYPPSYQKLTKFSHERNEEM